MKYLCHGRLYFGLGRFYMRQITENNRRIGAILSFGLVPLSGLATDLYLPSFPEMTQVFQVSDAAIQQTLAVFLVSYGLAQFFAGTVMDSFGRYRPTLIAIAVFIVANLLIISTRSIGLVYVYRILQGICAAFIAVGKRTYFVDAYSGKQQKSYTALLTIVWAAAPITAPFLGGFLQQHFSWQSCFYFLAIYAFVFLVLDLLFSGETLKVKAEFKFKPIIRTYGKLLNTRDFSAGMVILGFCYCMVMVFNMSVPFIVEHKFHLSPVVTGYCALFSGISMFLGGLIGRKTGINKLFAKVWIWALLQLGVIVAMLLSTEFLDNLILLMVFVMSIHAIQGLLYNLFFTHCLTRFPDNAATAGGITSGGSYIVVSLAIGLLLGLLSVNDQKMLALCYLILSVCILLLLQLFRKSLVRANKRMMVKERQEGRQEESQSISYAH